MPDTQKLTQSDWQRIIDEGFLCYNLYDELDEDNIYYKLIDDKTEIDSEAMNDLIGIVRESGIRQPHFKGHDHPNAGQIWAKISGEYVFVNLDYHELNWDTAVVTEYIV